MNSPREQLEALIAYRTRQHGDSLITASGDMQLLVMLSAAAIADAIASATKDAAAMAAAIADAID